MQESISQKTKRARQLFDAITTMIETRDFLVWEEGKLWYQLKNEGLWRYVFGEDGERSNRDSWTAFMLWCGIPMSTIEMKIRLHEFYRVKNNVDLKILRQIHTRKLDRAITTIERGEKMLIDVLDYAKELPFDEFLKWLKEK